jgi:FKBP-type peptidyl-prolyl cis-trans isomerase 2
LNIKGKDSKLIENGKKVSLEYTLKLDDGTTIDTNVGKDPVTFVQGEGQIIPGLEKALAGAKLNETKEITVAPEEGYGMPNPDAFQAVPLEAIPEDLREKGKILQAQNESGEVQHVRIHEIQDDKIVLDHNHLLAGENLNFTVRVLAIE